VLLKAAGGYVVWRLELQASNTTVNRQKNSMQKLLKLADI